MPSDQGSCVCGPNCFLITLRSRQDKTVSLEKHVCGVGESLGEVRPGGNPEQSHVAGFITTPWSRRGRAGRRGRGTRPGDAAVGDPLEPCPHFSKRHAHLNGVGDSEGKCAISLRTSHHFSPEFNIMPSWKNIKNVSSHLCPITNILPAAVHAETI